MAQDIAVTQELCVLPDRGVEIRRLKLRNLARRRRSLEITSCAGVALNDPAAHAAHPVFSKLFLQTELAAPEQCLLVRRRPRDPHERHPWMLHALLGAGLTEFETDRARFWGRGYGSGAPRALRITEPLSGTLGSVLDPILSLRTQVDLEGEAEVHIAYLLGAASDRADALARVRELAREGAVDIGFSEAKERAGADLKRLGLSTEEAEYLQALAAAVVGGHAALRAPSESREEFAFVAEDLSPLGMTTRRPWILLHAAGPGGTELLSDLHVACRYWDALGLPIQVVAITGVPPPSPPGDAPVPSPPTSGAPILLRPEDVSARLLEILDRGARLVMRDRFPEFASVAARDAVVEANAPLAPPGPVTPPDPASSIAVHAEGVAASPEGAAELGEPLTFWNGQGGFSADGSEYVIRVSHRQGRTSGPPRPWTNVVANERIGFLVSETGAGNTWTRNSREHRITPWANDPLLDSHAEAFYVRDEKTGDLASCFPGPAPTDADYTIRHGWGYTTCRVTALDLDLESTVFVPRADPVKVTRLRIVNRESRGRRVSLVSFYRLVLGRTPEETAHVLATRFDGASGAVLAWNPVQDACQGGIDGGKPALVFAASAASGPVMDSRITGDRRGFLGPGGDLAHPDGLQPGARLDGRVGSGLDPCIAQQVVLEIPAQGAVTVVFLLGEGETLAEIRTLVARYGDLAEVDRALKEVREFWKEGMAGTRITTPVPDIDLLVNGWLPYQTLSCRLWARSALYQSGGAFGYRDQLQDAAALVTLWPDRTRAQILLHAAHQFEEGDVLHWWHPPRDDGIRTRFADDLLWLPFVTAHYVKVTGDHGVLEQPAPFLQARALAPGEDEAYLTPERSPEIADVYEHCCRALDRSLTHGVHGLPLFGTGDWNDGMNRVGREGRGESVWLGFFLVTVLEAFLPLCRNRGDRARMSRYQAYLDALRIALNEAGWDGAWYRRGYYDDGAPLGSIVSDECKIDALAQAWAVLSGVAPLDRAHRALDAVEEHLISERDAMIRLLTPPFEATSKDPGYIKGYVPGVRENGGQYTHAALWVVEAMAKLGRNNRAARLLELLGPVHHTLNAERVAVYGAEPYVVAADVYGVAPHVGRAGWTWYTGSAGWMYRVALESILGFRVREGRFLVLDPCVPDAWPEFTIEYRIPGEKTAYLIHATNPRGMGRGIAAATLDGAPIQIQAGIAEVALVHDGSRHRVDLILGEPGLGDLGTAQP